MGQSWSVNAMGVMGVLGRVDDEGNELETAAQKLVSLSDEGATSLVQDDRRVLADAWEAVCQERREVPQKLMRVIADRCDQVTEATVAIITGDAQMGTSTQQNQSTALDEWGIHSGQAYVNPSSNGW